MSGTFGKFVLPSLLTSGAVFTALSLPLVLYGTERLDIHLTDDIKVSGTVGDFAAPYLGLSGLVSLAVGGAGLTIAGLGRSKKKSDLLEQQYLETQNSLKSREAEIQALLTSNQGLAKSGLDFFLDDTSALAAAPVLAVAPVADFAQSSIRPVPAAVQPVMAQPQPIHEVAVSVPPVAVSMPSEVQPTFSVMSTVSAIQPVKVPQVTVQTSISPMAAAHGFLGFVRSNQAVPSAAIAWLEESEPVAQEAVQLQDLQAQLQSLVGQIEQLQASLTPQPVMAGRMESVSQPETTKNNVTPHRFQPFEHAWAGAPQRIAS